MEIRRLYLPTCGENHLNNLYAFGAYPDDKGYNNSVIAHYTGNNWTMLNTDGLIGIVEQYYKNKSNGNYYLQTYRLGGGEYPDSSLIYEQTQKVNIKGYTVVYGLKDNKQILV